MPLIKSARKKLRQDKKRQVHNKVIKDAYTKAVKAARRTPGVKTLQAATKTLDKAVKHGILHKNKASRLKSSLAKHTVAPKGAGTKIVVPKKQAVKKKSSKKK